MAEEVSVFRLNLLRCMYLLNFALVGTGVAVSFIQRPEPWDPMPGVAFSFWAALAVLSAFGIRYPLTMLPIILMQLAYKTFWLLAVYVPLQALGRSSDLAQGFMIAAVLDIVVIPWSYVFTRYIKRPGEPWKSHRRAAA